jgi:hypothetical protein
MIYDLQTVAPHTKIKHEGRGFHLSRLSPFGFSSPLRVPSHANPSGLGHAATIYSSVQGPPGFETPTVGAPGRGLLRADEQRFPSSSRWAVSSNLSSPGRCSVSGVLSSCPSPAAESTTSSPRGGRTTFELAPSPPPPTEEEAGQPRPSRRRYLVGCRASRRRRRPNGGHVGHRPRV